MSAAPAATIPLKDAPAQVPAEQAARRPIRIWVDGCFDLMHFGHANALRQAKAMGDYLVVGVHSDAEIERNKGPTVMKDDERLEAVRACKWADEVVPDAPYTTSLEWMDRYDCDYCVHGDDITTNADGTDCYQLVKDAGRYWECKRTQGISTTELVGRMLLLTRNHHRRPVTDDSPIEHSVDAKEVKDFSVAATSASRRSSRASLLSPPEAASANAPASAPASAEASAEATAAAAAEDKQAATSISYFLPTSKRIVQFSSGREPRPGQRVVYVDGAFDLFHCGHIEFLRQAKALGDYLLVGVHDDKTINEIKGANYPIMNLHERVLSVLQCRHVDDVIIGAPYSVTKDVLEKVYRVDIVAHGANDVSPDRDGRDPYELPKKLGIYREIGHARSATTTETIIERIIQQRKLYEERQARKLVKARLEAEQEKARDAASADA